MRLFRAFTIFALCSAALPIACSSTSTRTSGGGECLPGSTQACLGPAACSGAQTCNDKGTGYGDCICGASGGAGGSGATGGSGASGGSSSGGFAGNTVGGTGGWANGVSCDDLVEGTNLTARWSTRHDGQTNFTLDVLGTADGPAAGNQFLRVTTEAYARQYIRYSAPSGAPIDASGKEELRFAVRLTTGDVSHYQGIQIEDASGVTAGIDTVDSDGPWSPGQSAQWQYLTLKLDGSATGWYDDGIDWSKIVAIEFYEEIYNSGFVFDLDGVSFESSGDSCE